MIEKDKLRRVSVELLVLEAVDKFRYHTLAGISHNPVCIPGYFLEFSQRKITIAKTGAVISYAFVEIGCTGCIYEIPIDAIRFIDRENRDGEQFARKEDLNENS